MWRLLVRVDRFDFRIVKGARQHHNLLFTGRTLKFIYIHLHAKVAQYHAKFKRKKFG